jgi:hypothetical protein
MVTMTFKKRGEDTLMTILHSFRIMSWQGGMRKVGTTFWKLFVSDLEIAHARNTAGMTLIPL